MENKTPFRADKYDENIRRVLPYYDAIYDNIFDLIRTYSGGRAIALLDTGCGSGTLGARAASELELSELVLCDPSEDMLDIAREKLYGTECTFIQKGSEELDFDGRFDVVTAIQCHQYFQPEQRARAVANCFGALKDGGIFICFENTAPFTEKGKDIMLRRVADFGIRSGRTKEEAAAHIARYGTEFFPINITEHIELLKSTGFTCAEVFWHSYMQTGFYAIK